MTNEIRNPKAERLRLSGLFGALLLCFLPGLRVMAHSPGEEMAQAATNFLRSLNAEQREKAGFDLKSEERFDWHFIPRPRKGLPFKEMTEDHCRLARAPPNSGLD